MGEKSRVMNLMKFVENVLNEFARLRDDGQKYFYLYERGNLAKDAIYELKELLKDDNELYILLKKAHLSLINNLNIIHINHHKNHSSFIVGKNHIYKLLEEFKQNKKYG